MLFPLSPSALSFSRSGRDSCSLAGQDRNRSDRFAVLRCSWPLSAPLRKAPLAEHLLLDYKENVQRIHPAMSRCHQMRGDDHAQFAFALPIHFRRTRGEPFMTHKKAGINQSLGDRCSAIAYRWARTTFGTRGESSADYQDSFAGVLRVEGTPLAISSDGIGTKVEIAERVGRYDTLGFDLLAMVADDLAAIGADPIAVSNILDADRLDETIIDELMSGLARAATESRVVVTGGEIAQLADRVSGYGDGMHFNWAATAIGVVCEVANCEAIGVVCEVADCGASGIVREVADRGDPGVGQQSTGCRATGSAAHAAPGDWRARLSDNDAIIALASDGFRSNGFTLARQILGTLHGPDWHRATTESGRTWGDALLVPSRIYAPGIIALIKDGVPLHGAVHVTGGGVPGNLARLLRGTGYGARLDTLWEPHAEMMELVRLGDIPFPTAYDQWNMGNGMLLVVPRESLEAAVRKLTSAGYRARHAGCVDSTPSVRLDGSGWGAGHLTFEVSR